MANWEYKIETRPMNLEGTQTVEHLLDNYGSEGWELVTIIPNYTTNDQNQVNDIFVQSYSFVFKREK
ncbi:hypothetical protein bcere0019_11220 [Bacillus cereus Rock3-28]|nr:hypothetical protein bcere0019_11220 [Bacillus cereus Rock3-28]